MKCYQCAKKGIDKDAVVMCVVCGMFLCMDHLFREELPIRHIISWGLGEDVVEVPVTLPRFICGDCKMVLDKKKPA